MSKHLLISIRPCFVEAIRSGVKRYEYRNYRPDGVVDFMVVYETRPRQVISTIVEVKQILSGYREDIWRKTHAQQSNPLVERANDQNQLDCNSTLSLFPDEPESDTTEEEDYYSYAYRYTYALELGKVYPLKKELRLTELPIFHMPPRGYDYLSDEELAFIAQWL